MQASKQNYTLCNLSLTYISVFFVSTNWETVWAMAVVALPWQPNTFSLKSFSFIRSKEEPEKTGSGILTTPAAAPADAVRARALTPEDVRSSPQVGSLVARRWFTASHVLARSLLTSESPHFLEVHCVYIRAIQHKRKISSAPPAKMTEKQLLKQSESTFAPPETKNVSSISLLI